MMVSEDRSPKAGPTKPTNAQDLERQQAAADRDAKEQSPPNAAEEES